MLKDADDRNAFDIEAYMKCRAKVKQRDEFELYEL
jgi:hypothetical protein